MTKEVRQLLQGMLVAHLIEVELADQAQDYDRRAACLYQALAMASQLRYPVGFEMDPKDAERPVVVLIELPTGQVSWHVRSPERPWDGHNTPEKSRRIKEYINSYDYPAHWTPLQSAPAGRDGE